MNPEMEELAQVPGSLMHSFQLESYLRNMSNYISRRFSELQQSINIVWDEVRRNTTSHSEMPRLRSGPQRHRSLSGRHGTEGVPGLPIRPSSALVSSVLTFPQTDNRYTTGDQYSWNTSDTNVMCASTREYSDDTQGDSAYGSQSSGWYRHRVRGSVATASDASVDTTVVVDEMIRNNADMLRNTSDMLTNNEEILRATEGKAKAGEDALKRNEEFLKKEEEVLKRNAEVLKSYEEAPKDKEEILKSGVHMLQYNVGVLKSNVDMLRHAAHVLSDKTEVTKCNEEVPTDAEGLEGATVEEVLREESLGAAGGIETPEPPMGENTGEHENSTQCTGDMPAGSSAGVARRGREVVKKSSEGVVATRFFTELKGPTASADEDKTQEPAAVTRRSGNTPRAGQLVGNFETERAGGKEKEEKDVTEPLDAAAERSVEPPRMGEALHKAHESREAERGETPDSAGSRGEGAGEDDIARKGGAAADVASLEENIEKRTPVMGGGIPGDGGVVGKEGASCGNVGLFESCEETLKRNEEINGRNEEVLRRNEEILRRSEEMLLKNEELLKKKMRALRNREMRKAAETLKVVKAPRGDHKTAGSRHSNRGQTPAGRSSPGTVSGSTTSRRREKEAALVLEEVRETLRRETAAALEEARSVLAAQVMEGIATVKQEVLKELSDYPGGYSTPTEYTLRPASNTQPLEGADELRSMRTRASTRGRDSRRSDGTELERKLMEHIYDLQERLALYEAERAEFRNMLRILVQAHTKGRTAAASSQDTRSLVTEVAAEDPRQLRGTKHEPVPLHCQMPPLSPSSRSYTSGASTVTALRSTMVPPLNLQRGSGSRHQRPCPLRGRRLNGAGAATGAHQNVVSREPEAVRIPRTPSSGAPECETMRCKASLDHATSVFNRREVESFPPLPYERPSPTGDEPPRA